MLDELIGEFEQVDSVWSRQEDELLDLLETMYSELQDNNSTSLKRDFLQYYVYCLYMYRDFLDDPKEIVKSK